MIQTYQEALDYIYSFVDPNRKASHDADTAARNLPRVRALLAAVGDPHLGMRAVVVAGTKGKGSTCALIEAIARAAGLRTGLWTSPHLNSYRERIQVDRQLIGQGELAALAERLRPAIERFDSATYGDPSAFDIGLALALTHFAERRVDLAVLEIGLGGRYDSVNVVTPLLSVISSISYDHMAILGGTLAEIAGNKAGIIKPGVPVISIPQPPEAAAVIAAEAEAVGAPLYIAGEAGIVRVPLAPGPSPAGRGAGGEGHSLAPYPVPPLPGRLPGGFQLENGRLAAGAALLLRAQGLPIDDAALAEGLAEAAWPGRFELVPGAPPILIDGAHNGDSAQKLAAALARELRYERLILVLGTSRDKDIPAIVAALVPQAAAVVLTRSGHPRAMDIDRIAAEVTPHLRGPLQLAPDAAAAIGAARALAGADDLICVTGSLFVVGAAREALGLAVSD